MREIVPAILPKSFEELEEKLPLVSGVVSCVQIDLCDGRFVQSTTWPYGTNHDDHFDAILKEEEGMPFWNELQFEFDLMCTKPEEAYQTAVQLGASRAIVHFGAFKDAAELDGFIARYGKEGTERGSILDVELGLAFLPSTPVETISQYVDRVDFIQIMGIERIGFQGEKFTDKALTLIKAVRAAHPMVIISVDGGIHADNAESILGAGADRLVVGSAIFDEPNASEIAEAFVHLTHDHA